VIDNKWMANIKTLIKTEMDAISHSLTERYETPISELTEDVEDLARKVNSHLKRMGYDL